MKIFKFECLKDFGVLIVRNKKIDEVEIQDNIFAYLLSIERYGYSSLEEMQKDGYKTVDDLFDNNDPPKWNIDDLVENAFPKSWKVSWHKYDGVVDE